MSHHSVASHLHVTPATYDAEVARLVMGYPQMLAEAVEGLAEQLPSGECQVLDLGAGTGAFSGRIAARLPAAKLTLVDVDASMLDEARKRLATESARVTYLLRSFEGALPSCDAAVASLSLHHVRSPEAKGEIYASIFRALRPGGVFVNADATIPSAPDLAKPIYRRWAQHLVAHGDTEAQAHERFKDWAKEDKYLTLEEELALLKGAGFQQLDVRWRAGPCTVLIARKGGDRDASGLEDRG